jgi:hypothetical protein
VIVDVVEQGCKDHVLFFFLGDLEFGGKGFEGLMDVKGDFNGMRQSV